MLGNKIRELMKLGEAYRKLSYEVAEEVFQLDAEMAKSSEDRRLVRLYKEEALDMSQEMRQRGYEAEHLE